jgi:hypothetical protein
VDVPPSLGSVLPGSKSSASLIRIKVGTVMVAAGYAAAGVMGDRGAKPLLETLRGQAAIDCIDELRSGAFEPTSFRDR